MAGSEGAGTVSLRLVCGCGEAALAPRGVLGKCVLSLSTYGAFLWLV